jgi:hypothetical protein
MGLIQRIKTEFHYMRLGAKVLPKILGNKLKASLKGKWEEIKENARYQVEIESEARRIEKEAYKEELLRQAALTGKEKARRKATGQGGTLNELAEIGKRMSQDNSMNEEMSAAEFLFGGLPKKRKEERECG